MGWLRVSCEGSDDNTCCTPPDCECDNTYATALPVTCPAYTEYQTSNTCNTGDCTAFDVIVSATFLSRWGCPWCDPCCGGELCEGELEDCTGTYEVGGVCWASFDESDWVLQPDVQCCPPELLGHNYYARADKVGNNHSPSEHTGDITEIFSAFSVTYDAANAGADVLDDLCEVYAGVALIVGGVGLYVDYVYNDGVCKRYTFRVYGDIHTAFAAGEYVDCINAQTTGSSAADLGLTATTADTTKLLTVSSLLIPFYPRTKIDSGASVPVYAYKPPNVWLSWLGFIDFSPCTCDSCEGSDLHTHFNGITDTMQRLNTTQAWLGTANCPYSYTWSIEWMDDRLTSLSLSMEDA